MLQTKGERAGGANRPTARPPCCADIAIDEVMTELWFPICFPMRDGRCGLESALAPRKGLQGVGEALSKSPLRSPVQLDRPLGRTRSTVAGGEVERTGR